MTLRTDFQPGGRDSASDRNRGNRILNSLLSSHAQYGIVTGDGAILTRRPPTASVSSDGFWAEITSSTSIGDNVWEYGFAEVRYLKEGQFSTVSASSSEGVSGTAYNTIESNNTDTGEQGNGITLPLPTGVTISPIGIGAIVWMRTAINCDTGATEYLFYAVNQIDGECASGS